MFLFSVNVVEQYLSIVIVNVWKTNDVKLADLIGCDIDLTGGTKEKIKISLSSTSLSVALLSFYPLCSCLSRAQHFPQHPGALSRSPTC